MFRPGDVVRLRPTPVCNPGESRRWIASLIEKYGHGPHVYKWDAKENGILSPGPRCFIATMDGEVLAYQDQHGHRSKGEWIDFRQCDIELDPFLTAVHRRGEKKLRRKVG